MLEVEENSALHQGQKEEGECRGTPAIYGGDLWERPGSRSRH